MKFLQWLKRYLLQTPLEQIELKTEWVQHPAVVKMLSIVYRKELKLYRPGNAARWQLIDPTLADSPKEFQQAIFMECRVGEQCRKDGGVLKHRSAFIHANDTPGRLCFDCLNLSQQRQAAVKRNKRRHKNKIEKLTELDRASRPPTVAEMVADIRRRAGLPPKRIKRKGVF